LNRGLPFIAAFVAARVLGPADFGTFVAAISLFTALLLAVDLGLSLTVTSRVATRTRDGFDALQQTITTALLATTTLGCLFAVLITLLASSLSRWVYSSADHGLLVLSGALYVPAAAIAYVAGATLQGLQRYKQIAAIGATFGAVHLGGVLLGAYLFGAVGATWGAAATMALRAFLAVYALRDRLGLHLRQSLLPELRTLVTDSAPACLAAFAMAPAATFVVSAIFRHPQGATEAGGYGAALQAFSAAMVIPSILTQYALPQLAKFATEDANGTLIIRDLAVRYAALALGCTLLIALPVVLFAREILSMLGQQYETYVLELRIMMVAAVVAAPQGVFSNYLLARGRHWVRATTAWAWPLVVVLILWDRAPSAADAAFASFWAWLALSVLRAGMFISESADGTRFPRN